MQLLHNATMINALGQQCDNQSIVVDKEHVTWCGPATHVPEEYLQQGTIQDCRGKLITPGLIDCHTHLVYAGDRALEFKLKLEGVSYADIAQAGGGILSTVRDTRAASEQDLFEQSLPRLQALGREGVTCVEIKSGYGLNLATELKILRVAKLLGQHTGIRVKTTFLGAHALPPEYKNKQQAYVDFLCDEVMPAIAENQLADAVDVFCESIGFTYAQTEQIFIKALDLSLAIKCHAEQLSNIGASRLAASYGALSCDHLEFLDETAIEAMAKSGTVAVLLPGAFYYLAETQKPPIAGLREKGVKMAIASDCNPGTSPTTSLLLMINMACRLFGLSVEEALAGVTSVAARALGIEKETGSIAPGLLADLVLWSVQDSAHLAYYFGYPIAHDTMIAGRWVNK